MSIPLPRFFRPVVIDSTNCTIALYVTGDLPAPIPIGTYYSPESLIQATGFAIHAALQGANGAWGCTTSIEGTVGQTMSAKFTASAGGAGITVKWSTVFALGRLLGFTATGDVTYPHIGSSVIIEPGVQMPGLWLPNQVVRSDSRETSTFSRAVVESTGGVVGVDLARLRRRKITFEKLHARKVFIADEETVNEAAEHLWRDWPTWFLFHADARNTDLGETPDKADKGNGLIYALDEKTAQVFQPKRAYDALEIYNLELGLVGTH